MSNKSFSKLEATISEKFAKQLEDFNEDEYRKLEELKELFEFLDDIIPDDDDEVIDIDAQRKRSRKRYSLIVIRLSVMNLTPRRRSPSITSASTENDRPESPVPSKRGKSSKPKAKYVLREEI